MYRTFSKWKGDKSIEQHLQRAQELLLSLSNSIANIIAFCLAPQATNADKIDFLFGERTEKTSLSFFLCAPEPILQGSVAQMAFLLDLCFWLHLVYSDCVMTYNAWLFLIDWMGQQYFIYKHPGLYRVARVRLSSDCTYGISAIVCQKWYGYNYDC